MRIQSTMKPLLRFRASAHNFGTYTTHSGRNVTTIWRWMAGINEWRSGPPRVKILQFRKNIRQYPTSWYINIIWLMFIRFICYNSPMVLWPYFGSFHLLWVHDGSYFFRIDLVILLVGVLDFDPWKKASIIPSRCAISVPSSSPIILARRIWTTLGLWCISISSDLRRWRRKSHPITSPYFF